MILPLLSHCSLQLQLLHISSEGVEPMQMICYKSENLFYGLENY